MKRDELKYFQTGEWQVVEENLNELDLRHIRYNPTRSLLFRSIDLLDLDDVRVVILGQDPYPNPAHATGIAFSIPRNGRTARPPTLINLFQEYQDDLHYPCPQSGDLTKWAKQGVLLWNAYPTCEAGKPASHHWVEWEPLTKELVEKCAEKGVVFILLGRVAQKFAPYCGERQRIIETSHPSPLGAKHGFLGSRVFSRANDIRRAEGKSEVDWRLD
jgi:uracil-DNA glycosylase